MASIYPDIRHSSLLGNGRPEQLRLLLHAVYTIAGPCHLVALLAVVPAFAASIILYKANFPGDRERRHYALVRAGLGLLSMASAYVFLITPFAAEDSPGSLNQLRGGYCPLRYGLSFFNLAVVFVAMLCRDLTQLSLSVVTSRLPTTGASGSNECSRILMVNAQEMAAALLCVIAFFQFTRTFSILRLHVLDSLLALVILLMLLERHHSQIVLKPFNALIPMCIALSIMGGWLSSTWHEGYVAFYGKTPAHRALLNQVGTYHAATRICVFDLFPYEYFGSSRQYHVVNPLQAPADARKLEEYLATEDANLVIVQSKDSDTVPGWNRFRFVTAWFEKYGASRYGKPFTDGFTSLYDVGRSAFRVP